MAMRMSFNLRNKYGRRNMRQSLWFLIRHPSRELWGRTIRDIKLAIKDTCANIPTTGAK